MTNISPKNPLSDSYACADMTLALNSALRDANGHSSVEANLGSTLRCVYVEPNGTACKGVAKVVQSPFTGGNTVRVFDVEGNESFEACRYRVDGASRLVDTELEDTI